MAAPFHELHSAAMAAIDPEEPNRQDAYYRHLVQLMRKTQRWSKVHLWVPQQYCNQDDCRAELLER